MTPAPDALDAARAALRARQGAGARYDAPAAPADALRWARLGTAAFARKLAQCDDAGLAAPSRRQGGSRRRLVAAVGLEARAMAQVIAAACGEASPEIADVDDAALDLAQTLPARALRHLVAHAGAHLDIVWRDLTGGQWDLPLAPPYGQIRATAFARARTLWTAAVDLESGARLTDAPADFLAALRRGG